MRNMNKIIEWKFIHAKQKTGVVETKCNRLCCFCLQSILSLWSTLADSTVNTKHNFL